MRSIKGQRSWSKGKGYLGNEIQNCGGKIQNTCLREVSQEGGHEAALRDLEGGYVVLVQHREDLPQRPLAVLGFPRQMINLRTESPEDGECGMPRSQGLLEVRLEEPGGLLPHPPLRFLLQRVH